MWGAWGKGGCAWGVAIGLCCALVSPAAALAEPPANDDLANAEVLTGLPTAATGTTTGATLEPGEPQHDPLGGHSIWYSWQAPSSGWVTAETCLSGSLSTVDVYTGAALVSLTQIAASAPEMGYGCGFDPSSLANFRATAGTVYEIAVDGADGATGPIELSLSSTPQPPHDDFASPQWLGGNFGHGEGTTVGATHEAGEPVPPGWGGATIWFAWTAPEDGALTVSTCGSSFDAEVAAYVGSSLPSLVPVGRMVPGFPGPCESHPQLALGVDAGTTYRFAVDGAAVAGTGQVETGNVWLRFDLGMGYPQNDGFSNALWVPRSGDSTELTGTYGATKQFGEPAHAGDPGGASVWFKWLADEPGTAEFSTCGSSFDTLLAVYTGTSVRALTPVTSNDDSAGPRCPQTSASEVRFQAVAGTEYRIAVDGAGGTGGTLLLRHDFTSTVDRLPPNTILRHFRIDSRRRRATFHFRGSEPGVGFRCELDHYRWETCSSPWTVTRLAVGRHVFRVAARDAAGNVDTSPRAKRFLIRSAGAG